MKGILEQITLWDKITLEKFILLRTPMRTRLFSLVSYSGLAIVWFLLAALLVILQNLGWNFIPRGQEFLVALLPAGIVWIVGGVIKRLIKRQRPYQAYSFTTLVNHPGLNDSFPSSHVSTTSAFLCSLLIIQHPLIPIVFIWWLAIGLSRLYLGVHYLSDVLGGMILGVFTAILFYLF